MYDQAFSWGRDFRVDLVRGFQPAARSLERIVDAGGWVGAGSSPAANAEPVARERRGVRSGARWELLAASVPPIPPGDNPPSVDSRDLFEILTREHIDSVRAFLLSTLRDNGVSTHSNEVLADFALARSSRS